MQVKFKKIKEATNTVRFEQTDERASGLMPKAIYVAKDKLTEEGKSGYPDEITITITW